MKYLISIIFISFLVIQPIFSSHIYGTEFTYTCDGNDDYTFKLTVYADCSLPGTGIPSYFDNPAYFTVFTGDGNIFETKPSQTYFSVNHNSANDTTINAQLSNPCLIPPTNTCIIATYYELTVNLPYDSLGYYIAYERCCRNNTVANILNSGIEGMIANIFLSREAQLSCNNSPTFANHSNYLFCVNEVLDADFGAIDLDGDSLVYSLCSSNGGSSPTNPQPQNVSSPPPFPNAIYSNGFSPTQPISGTLSINSQTGIVTAFPTATGIYAVAICVDEYRNGVLLSSIKRDIQIIITYCPRTIAASLFCDSVSLDGMFHVNSCDNIIDFTNQSGQLQFIDEYLWTFDIESKTTPSYLTNPTIIFPDSVGVYTGRLIVNPNSSNCSDTAEIIVHIHNDDSLKVDFLYNYDSTIYDPMAFQSLAENPITPITKWLWNFGDNYDSELINPVHYYPDSGIYTVKHTVIDSVGCSKNISKEVEWMPLPILLNNETVYSSSNIQLYPNPVSDMLNIEIKEANFNNEFSISIYDTIGKLVFEKESQEKSIISIPVHHLSNGQYFLLISNQKEMHLSKFIVLK